MMLWRYLVMKFGMKKGYMLAFRIFIITLIPFMFISPIEISYIAFIITGIGLSSLSIYKFPITKEKYKEIKLEIEKLHLEKKERTRNL